MPDAAGLRRHARLQRPVDVGERAAGQVEAAVVDEGRDQDAARVAHGAPVGAEGMLRPRLRRSRRSGMRRDVLRARV